MKNFLFDLYGTLIDIRTDEESGGFWEKIACGIGASDPMALRSGYRQLCLAAHESLPEGGEFDLVAIFRELLFRFAKKDCAFRADIFSFARFFRETSLLKLRLFDGAKELLCGTHVRGGGVYLLSNAQACFTRRELEITGISRDFDGILLSSEAGWRKPSPRFFQAAFAQFSLDPKDCIYVGNDKRDDVGGAHAAGLPCVYIATEQSGIYENAPVPDYTAPNHRALAELLFTLL